MAAVGRGPGQPADWGVHLRKSGGGRRGNLTNPPKSHAAGSHFHADPSSEFGIRNRIAPRNGSVFAGRSKSEDRADSSGQGAGVAAGPFEHNEAQNAAGRGPFWFWWKWDWPDCAWAKYGNEARNRRSL